MILGKGEVAVISLAEYTQSPLLVDNKMACDFSKKRQIKITGTAGILLLAKKHGLIKKVNPFLLALKQRNYHLSNTLITEIFKLAKE